VRLAFEIAFVYLTKKVKMEKNELLVRQGDLSRFCILYILFLFSYFRNNTRISSTKKWVTIIVQDFNLQSFYSYVLFSSVTLENDILTRYDSILTLSYVFCWFFSI
jgi:hypothetical protein